MSKATLDVDDRSLSRTTKKLEGAIERAQHQAVQDALEDAIDEGQERIRNKEAIWKWQTYESFKWSRYGTNHYHILNTASYAGVVDKGAKFKDHPPADSLIPWVRENLADWHPVQEEARDRLDINPDEPLDPSGDDDDPSGDSPSTFTDYSGDDASSTSDDNSPNWADVKDDSSTSMDSGGTSSGGGVGWGDVSEVDDSMHDPGEDDDGSFDIDSAPYTFQPMGDKQRLQNFGTPTTVSGALAGKIDYTSSKSVVTGTFDSDFTYDVLPVDHEDTMLNFLRFSYHEDPVDTIISDIQTWKESAFSKEGAHLEAIAKAQYDIDAPIRGADQFDVPEVTPEQKQVFHELSIASQEYLNTHYSTSGQLQLYRGLRSHQVAVFSKSMIEKPRADSWNAEDTVIQNYTMDTEIAEKFSEGIEVATTVDADGEVILGPDFVLDDNHDGLRNSEVWVVGGEHQFSADTMSISGHMADDLMKKDPFQYTESELEAIELLVNAMYNEGTHITTDAGASWLREWLRAYEDAFGESKTLEDKIEEIIQ